MDLHAYHRALNLGFSESEASRIGDDAWENNRQQPTRDPEPEPDYYDVLVAENTRLRAELEETRRENDVLRGKLAMSELPCAYCGLSKENWGRCHYGFPGCGRADDAVLLETIDAALAAEGEK